MIRCPGCLFREGPPCPSPGCLRAERCPHLDLWKPEGFVCPRCDDKGYIVVHRDDYHWEPDTEAVLELELFAAAGR